MPGLLARARHPALVLREAGLVAQPGIEKAGNARAMQLADLRERLGEQSSWKDGTDGAERRKRPNSSSTLPQVEASSSKPSDLPYPIPLIIATTGHREASEVETNPYLTWIGLKFLGGALGRSPWPRTSMSKCAVSVHASRSAESQKHTL